MALIRRRSPLDASKNCSNLAVLIYYPVLLRVTDSSANRVGRAWSDGESVSSAGHDLSAGAPFPHRSFDSRASRMSR